MKITIKGTGLTLSDSIYEYIYDKIGGLEKFVQDIGEESERGNPPVECWVEVERTTKHHQSGDIFRAEIQIKLPGAMGVRTESTKWDLHQAIDEAKDEMQRRLKRYKRKQGAKQKRGARKAKDMTRFSESAK
mgnify:CR=1 FL=1